MKTCSCGDSKDHVIAKRRTFDNKLVELWSDGSLTLGVWRFIVASKLTSEMLSLLAGEISLYDSTEVKFAGKVARAAFRQVSLAPLAYFRQRMGAA